MYRFAALTLAALAVLVPTASASVYSGSGADPTGDGPAPARDLTGVEAAFDDTAGVATASVTFAANPDPVFFYIQIGTLNGGVCDAPAVALGGYTDQTSGVWTASDDVNDVQTGAQITLSQTKLTITASAARIANLKLKPNCVTARITPQGDTNTILDALDAPAGLTAPAPPPPTTTTPPPAPPTTTTTPAPAPAPKAPVKAPKKVAQLAVTVSGVPSTIRRNRTMSLKVKIANTGTAAATGVKVKASTARGLSVKPRTITVKTLKAGKATTRRVKVKLTAKARTTTTLTLTASGAKKLKALSRVALKIGKAKKPKPTKTKPTTNPTPTGPKSPLAGTYWWYTINHVDSAWDNHGVYFLDDNWAYLGIPKGGLPTACSTAVAGCVPYTYDASSGALTVGSAAGTYKDGKLQFADQGDMQDFTKLLVPEAGARYDVDLVHRGFEGMCGLILGCTTWTYWLELLPDGQFVYSRSTTSTMGDPGSGPFTAVGSYPPDQHGTYEVQPNGRIHLAYADGTVKDYTFAVQYSATGQPDPGGEGVFLDEDNFYKDTMP